MKFYKISRFDTFITNNEHYSWNNIYDVPEKKYLEYLNIEKEFISFLKNFYDFFCKENIKNFGYSSLAYNIILDVENVNCIYQNMKYDILRLKSLQKVNIEFLSDDDIYFLFQCWIRKLCNLYLYDISSNSFLKPMDGDFYFYLALKSDIYAISDIFKYNKNIYVFTDLDHYNYSENYIPPTDLGKRIYW